MSDENEKSVEAQLTAAQPQYAMLTLGYNTVGALPVDKLATFMDCVRTLVPLIPAEYGDNRLAVLKDAATMPRFEVTLVSGKDVALACLAADPGSEENTP